MGSGSLSWTHFSLEYKRNKVPHSRSKSEQSIVGDWSSADLQHLSESKKGKWLHSWTPWSPWNVLNSFVELATHWFSLKLSCLTHFKAQLLTLPYIMGNKCVCLWVWVPRARLHTGCRCLGSTVCWLRRGTRLSLQAGRLRCAERGVWHFCCGGLWTFHPHFSPKWNLLIPGMWDVLLGRLCTNGSN